MSPGHVVGPGILVNEVGKGRVITVPLALDAAYVGDYRMPEHRKLLRDLVRYLHPDPVVEIDAPVNVESVVTGDRERRRFYVHLLAFNGAPTFSASAFTEGRRVLPPVMEEAMLYSARIHVRGRVASVGASGPATEIERSGNTIRLTTGEIHEVVTIGR
jgi:hypothetical protein